MRLIVLIGVFFSLFSCKNDDSNEADFKGISLDLNVVTGIAVRANFEDPSIIYGNPNNFSEKMVLYPNPVISNLSIKTNNKITNAWIIPATPQLKDQEVDFSNKLTSNSVFESEVISNSIVSKEYNFSDSKEKPVNTEEGDVLTIDEFRPEFNKEIDIDVRSLEPGYYKVFVKVDDALFWDNFLIPSETNSFEDLEAFWKKVSK